MTLSQDSRLAKIRGMANPNTEFLKRAEEYNRDTLEQLIIEAGLLSSKITRIEAGRQLTAHERDDKLTVLYWQRRGLPVSMTQDWCMGCGRHIVTRGKTCAGCTEVNRRWLVTAGFQDVQITERCTEERAFSLSTALRGRVSVLSVFRCDD